MNNLLENNEADLEGIEREILNVPTLKDLNKEQLNAIAKLVTIDRYKKELSRSVDILSVNYEKEKKVFLNNLKSEHTKDAYNYAIKDFEKYMIKLRKLKSPLECTQAIADDYIYNLSEQGKAVTTISRNIGAVGSLFSFLERRTNGKVSNIFRGTKARPKVKSNTIRIYPNNNDIEIILQHINNETLKAIILIMVKRGLRVGAFEKMKIYGDKFYTESKGKDFVATLPTECIMAVKKARLNFKEPFKHFTANRIKNLFKYHTKKLKLQGFISTAFSCHDLRHYFAITEYSKDKDIYRLSKLLNHSSVVVTERYLKGLKYFL